MGTGWGPLGVKCDLHIPEFTDEPGIIYKTTNHMGPKQKAQHNADMTTPIYWFRRFFDHNCVMRILNCTNEYVAELAERERPGNLRMEAKWPLKWVVEWTELTEATLWKWLACLLFISQHKTGGEEELWSKHWFWERPGMSCFMPYKEFQQIKSAIHMQLDDEPLDRGEGERPYIRKIGIFMELISNNCMHNYIMGKNNAIDEVTVGLSSASQYRKITKHKKKHESIQLFAIGESTEGLQYCWNFHLDENDGEVNKIHNHVFRLIKELEPLTGHHVYMDNLFVNTKTLNAVREMGHGMAGTCRKSRGMPPHIEGIKTKNTKPNPQAVESGVTEQGDWVFACNQAFNLLACAWFDSGICHFMSNMHNADGSVVQRSKKRHGGKLTVTCPLVAAHYNEHMTAIDYINRVRDHHLSWSLFKWLISK